MHVLPSIGFLCKACALAIDCLLELYHLYFAKLIRLLNCHLRQWHYAIANWAVCYHPKAEHLIVHDMQFTGNLHFIVGVYNSRVLHAMMA
jgi:hypothetical protein